LQPVQVLKAHSPKYGSKSFHTTQLMDELFHTTQLFLSHNTTQGCQKKPFAPNTPDPLCAKAQDTWFLLLPEMVAFKDPLTLYVGYLASLGSSFVMEIQAHARSGVPTFLLPCTPSAFRQRRMYPFRTSKDKHVPLQHFDGWTCSTKISYDKIFCDD